MDRRIVISIAYRVAVYVATIIALEVVLGKEGLLSNYLQERKVGLLSNFLYLNLPPFLRPLQYACTLLFISSILRLVLVGKLADSLASSTKMLAFGIFFYTLFNQHPMLTGFSSLGSWVFICSMIVASKEIVDTVFSLYHIDHLRPLSTCVSVFLAGYFLSTMLRSFPPYITYINFALRYAEQLRAQRIFDFRYIISTLPIIFALPVPIDTMVFYSSVFASALSLLGMLSHYRNPYVSYFGGIFSKASNIFGLFVLFTLIQIYFFNLRPVLLDVFPWYVPPLEWIAVCLVALAAFMMTKSYVSSVLSERLQFGEWMKHIQKVVYEKRDLESASEAIRRFVEEGAKEGVTVYLTSMLLRNGVQLPKIEKVVRYIVNYEDTQPPRLTLFYNLESLEEENMRRRMKVLISALKEAENILNLPAPLINVEGEGDENREV